MLIGRYALETQILNVASCSLEYRIADCDSQLSVQRIVTRASSLLLLCNK